MNFCRYRKICLGKRICLLEVMADLQPYRFEPGERVPNPEDGESEHEKVNDRLEGTFWCSCERLSNHANAKRMCLLPRTARVRKQNSR